MRRISFMTIEEQYKNFEELDKLASQGGGIERVEKQHANGHMTARERIDMLLDKGSLSKNSEVNYRLRMWVADTTILGEFEKTFGVRVSLKAQVDLDN